MDQAADLSNDVLTGADYTALREVARRLWPIHREIAAEWARRLLSRIPTSVSASVALPMVTDINAAFLVSIFEHVTNNQLPELYETYYTMNRRLIEADLSRPSVER